MRGKRRHSCSLGRTDRGCDRLRQEAHEYTDAIMHLRRTGDPEGQLPRLKKEQMAILRAYSKCVQDEIWGMRG